MYVEFKEGKKYAEKDADISPSDESFKDAGYVLTKNDLIVDIDCLTKDQIKQLIKWFDIKTETVWTDRGVHFYFNKPSGFRGARSKTALGIEVEYKHIKNTSATTVKRNGVARKTENKGVRSDFPDIFRPDRKVEDLLGLSDHDGRNSKLFSHRARISKYQNWRQILSFINEVIFADPLPKDEFEEITRDMKVTAVKDGENLIADVVAQDLKIVKYSHQLWYRASSSEWYKQDDVELKRLIYTYCPDQKSRYVEEVFTQISMRTKPIDDNKVFDIRLNNGILRKGKFIDIQSDDFTPYAIDLEYHEDAKPVKMVDDYLDNLTGHDPKYRQMIEEVLGYCLFTDRELIRLVGKFFFFIGDGGNGKGTLLEIIRKIVGTQNAGSLSIDELVDERYSNTLSGKLVNLGDDVEDKPIDEKKMKMLKNISTADQVSLRKLYSDATTASLSSTLIFTTNHILKSFEKGESYKRRVMWCPMYGKPKHKSPTFITDITTKDALEYWIKIVVDGYERLFKTMTFTKSEKVQKFNEEYHEENNSVLEYTKDIHADDLIGETSPEAYEDYADWADENDYKIQSKRLFKETLQNEMGIILKPKKINGHTKRIFAKEETDPQNDQ